MAIFYSVLFFSASERIFCILNGVAIASLLEKSKIFFFLVTCYLENKIIIINHLSVKKQNKIEYKSLNIGLHNEEDETNLTQLSPLENKNS